MTIFRWAIGVISLLTSLGAIASFILFILSDVQIWIGRARRLRHWTWVALLLWFNVEIWGRVAITIINWK